MAATTDYSTYRRRGYPGRKQGVTKQQSLDSGRRKEQRRIANRRRRRIRVTDLLNRKV